MHKRLPDLADYNENQWSQAFARSSAISRYKTILDRIDDTASLYYFRHDAWLKAAMATFHKTADTESICKYWSHAAEHLLVRAWNEAGLDAFPAALFALGKLGAEELNLSSDTDLLLVCETSALQSVEGPFRKFRATMSQMTELGWLLRLDFDLRPGGKSSPLWVTPDRFENHYWTQGEAWERLALVRFRSLTGEQNLIKTISEMARKYSYRKFLDYTLLDDLKVLRPKIHALSLQYTEGWDLKTGVGGIRDIELFAHALQVLHGGRLPDLQTFSTTAAYKKLATADLLKEDIAKYLTDNYWSYRDLENQVQLVEDRQTHFLSNQNPYPELSDESRSDLEAKRKKIDSLVSDVLGSVSDSVTLVLPPPEQQRSWLLSLGFSYKSFSETWPTLLNATVLSKKSERDETVRLQVIRLFVEEMSKTGLDLELGLQLLLDFIKSTRAKATFFSLLLRTPRLIQDLARLFSISPYLGGVIASRPELIDSFIYKSQSTASDQLDEALSQFSERRLLTEVLSSLEFLNDQNIAKLQKVLSDTADHICTNLLHLLIRDLKLPRAPSIVALGKWGGRELGLRSDLDFIFVTDQPSPESDARLARRMMSRLTEQQRGGSLYNVDLRLRPSGHAGPLIVHETRLLEYFEKEASAWERQSYLRGRSLGQFHLNPLLQLIAKRGLSDQDIEELREIRKKLITSNAADEQLNLKHSPGGLIEIEFAVQNTLLKTKTVPTSPNTTEMIEQLMTIDSLWKKFGSRLIELYFSFRQMEQFLQLLASRSVSQVSFTESLFTNTAQLLGQDVESLRHSLTQNLHETRAILKQLDPIYLER